MTSLYDEDGVDGPFERGMAEPIHLPTYERKDAVSFNVPVTLTRYRCSCGRVGVWFSDPKIAEKTFARHDRTGRR